MAKKKQAEHHRSSPYEPELKDIPAAVKKPKSGTKTVAHSNRPPKKKAAKKK